MQCPLEKVLSFSARYFVSTRRERGGERERETEWAFDQVYHGGAHKPPRELNGALTIERSPLWRPK